MNFNFALPQQHSRCSQIFKSKKHFPSFFHPHPPSLKHDSSFFLNLKNRKKHLKVSILQHENHQPTLRAAALKNDFDFENELENESLIYFKLISYFISIENEREDGLLKDSYAKCFLNNILEMEGLFQKYKQYYDKHVISTYFIDSQIMNALSNPHYPVKQLILLSDGIDTRVFRLSLPKGTIVFHISSEQAFNYSSSILKDSGAEILKGCFFRHLPAKLYKGEKFSEKLLNSGYRSDKPSVWAIQNLIGLRNDDSFECLMDQISSLAMSGSSFFGQIAFERDSSSNNDEECFNYFGSIFGRHGFLFQPISWMDVAMELGRKVSHNLTTENYASIPNDVSNRTNAILDSQTLFGLGNGGKDGSLDMSDGYLSTHFDHFLFVSTQQRLSDLQMQIIYDEISMAEEGGDELGFEDMP